jgi:hypothetical protein
MKGIHLLAIITLSASVVGVAQVPPLINYQGRLAVGVTNVFTGQGRFKFALVSKYADVSYWSNDGSSRFGGEPTLAVPLIVRQGLFTINLGDSGVSNMTSEIPSYIFTNSEVRLRMWFSDSVPPFQQFYPDQRLTSAGYAMVSATVLDGAITRSKLAQGAVDSNALAANAIGSANIADNAVTASKLAPGAASGFQNAMLVFSNSAIWSKPPGVARVHAKLWGGGQGGLYLQESYQFGGVGGAYCEGDVEVTGDVFVEVGLGGTNFYGSGGAPGDGGRSSFLSLIASGGSSGATASGGKLNLNGNPRNGSSGGASLMGGAGWGAGANGGRNRGANGLVIVYY